MPPIDVAIFRIKSPLTLDAFASLTEAVKLKFPACEVIPEIVPLFRSKESPSGNAPPETCQL